MQFEQPRIGEPPRAPLTDLSDLAAGVEAPMPGLDVSALLDAAPNTPDWNPSQSFASTKSLTAGLGVTFADIPHRRFVYGIDLSRGEITVLASPGGTGKSSLAIGITVSLVVSKRLFREKIWGADLKVLYVNGEDSALEMRRRLWGFCRRHSLTEQDIGNLLLLGADDPRTHKLSFLRTEKSNSVIDQTAVGFLGSLLSELRPDVVVLASDLVLRRCQYQRQRGDGLGYARIETAR
jgi:AAA domain